MSKFRPAARTVVTEIKSFIVDTVTRTGAFRQNVSARIQNDSPFVRQSVNVTDTEPYVIPDVSSVIAIDSPHPVRLVLTQLTTVEPPEIPDETIDPPAFEMPVSFFAGDALSIVVRNGHIPFLGAIEVVVLNLTTGETETCLLESVEPGVFKGDLQTALSIVPGTNFDQSMNVMAGHSVVIQYNYENLKVESKLQVESKYVDPVLTVPRILFPGRPIPIVLEHIDSADRLLTCTVINLSTGQNKIVLMNEIDPGVFYSQVNTDDTLDSYFSVEVGDLISVAFGTDLFATTNVVESIIEVQEARYIPAELSIDTDIIVGEKSLVVLNDYNRVGAGSIELVVSNLRSREYILVRCNESVPNSGIFIGSLLTHVSGAVPDSLLVREADTLSVSYVDTSGDEPVRLEDSGIVMLPVAAPLVVPSVVETVVTDKLDIEPDQSRNEVEIIVNGLFFLNGSFDGEISIYGLTEEYVRCSIMCS